MSLPPGFCLDADVYINMRHTTWGSGGSCSWRSRRRNCWTPGAKTAMMHGTLFLEWWVGVAMCCSSLLAALSAPCSSPAKRLILHASRAPFLLACAMRSASKPSQNFVCCLQCRREGRMTEKGYLQVGPTSAVPCHQHSPRQRAYMPKPLSRTRWGVE
jgi:hypothetical protein